MTDNEIIKALENEVKSTEYVDSDYCDGVDLTLIKSAIDLINCQQVEIERLRKEVNLVSIQFQDLQERTDKIKVEAYKEFAERLKEEWFNDDYDSPDVDFDEFVDNLLKEMVGED